MSEDISALEEELAEARAELETLRASVADREARSAQLEVDVVELREQLEQAREESEARTGELAALESRSQASVERYRALVLEASPELPEEFVTGATVEEIDASVEHARQTVAKVRGRLEAQAQAGRVPAGAPPRSGPDASAMSTEEKIATGLERRPGQA